MTGPDGFGLVAGLRADRLSAAIRIIVETCRAVPEAPRVTAWLDAHDRTHDLAADPPAEQRVAGLAFAGDAAFGSLEADDGGGFTLNVNHGVEDLREDEQRAVMHAWTDVCRALLRHGALRSAALTRQRGGHCQPYLPLVGNATHMLVCAAARIEQVFSDQDAFLHAWDAVEAHGEMRLCRRGENALANPTFVGHVLPGQMAMARAARPGLTRFHQPHFEPGERELLDAGDPTVTGVGYHAAEQVYELAGHTPIGVELRCIDLLMVWRICSVGSVEGGGPVREVRVVFMDEEQATRSAKLLQEAGATVYWEDSQAQLHRVPSVLPGE